MAQVLPQTHVVYRDPIATYDRDGKRVRRVYALSDIGCKCRKPERFIQANHYFTAETRRKWWCLSCMRCDHDYNVM